MKDIEIFPGKNLSDLLKTVYTNSQDTKQEIRTHIEGIMKHIASVQDAAILAPIVAQFLGEGIKNDEQLIKIAQIVQRLMSAEITSAGVSTGEILTEAEKAMLMDNARQNMNDVLANLEKKVSNK